MNFSTPDLSTINFSNPDFSTLHYSTLDPTTQSWVGKFTVEAYRVEESRVVMSYNKIIFNLFTSHSAVKQFQKAFHHIVLGGKKVFLSNVRCLECH